MANKLGACLALSAVAFLALLLHSSESRSLSYHKKKPHHYNVQQPAIDCGSGYECTDCSVSEQQERETKRERNKEREREREGHRDKQIKREKRAQRQTKREREKGTETNRETETRNKEKGDNMREGENTNRERERGHREREKCTCEYIFLQDSTYVAKVNSLTVTPEVPSKGANITVEAGISLGM